MRPHLFRIKIEIEINGIPNGYQISAMMHQYQIIINYLVAFEFAIGFSCECLPIVSFYRHCRRRRRRFSLGFSRSFTSKPSYYYTRLTK